MLFINRHDLGHFDNVAGEYSKLISLLARSYSLSDGETDDLSQEGLIALYKAFLTYRKDNGTSFSTYASKCIKNSMTSWVRANRPPKDVVIDDIDEKKHNLYSADDIEKQVLDKELYNRVIDGAMELLSQNEQKVFALILRDMKNREIAQALGISSKSVENTVYRIKNKLKSKLSI